MPLGDDRGYRRDAQRSSIADQALSCVGCHREQAKALNESGFFRFRQGLYNDAYVVGMSRNDDLDLVSLGVLVLVLLGIVAHATGHRVAYRKRSRS
jgi:hypothetical protein